MECMCEVRRVLQGVAGCCKVLLKFTRSTLNVLMCFLMAALHFSVVISSYSKKESNLREFFHLFDFLFLSKKRFWLDAIFFSL